MCAKQSCARSPNAVTANRGRPIDIMKRPLDRPPSRLLEIAGAIVIAMGFALLVYIFTSKQPAETLHLDLDLIHHPPKRRVIPILHLDPAVEPTAAVAISVRTSSTPRGSTLRRNLEGTGLPPHHCFLGPFGNVTNRGDRATASLPHICVFRFSCFVCPIRFFKGNANAGHRCGFGNSGSLAAGSTRSSATSFLRRSSVRR
jgi:hypothetical protein